MEKKRVKDIAKKPRGSKVETVSGSDNSQLVQSKGAVTFTCTWRIVHSVGVLVVMGWEFRLGVSDGCSTVESSLQ